MKFLLLTTLALGISALLGVMRIDDGKLRIAKITILSLTISIASAFAFKDDAKFLCLIYYHAREWLDEKGLR